MSEEQVKQEYAVEEVENLEIDGVADEQGEDIPVWLSEETPENDTDGSNNDSVPLATYLEKKNQAKGQSAKIERLEAELENLKAAKQTPSGPNVDALKVPTMEDFDHDEEKYREAMQQWATNVSDSNYQKLREKSQAEEAQREASEYVQKSLVGHWDRADKLIKENSIKPEVYVETDKAVRNAVETIRPGQSDGLINAWISLIGEGSEKVMFYLGKHPTELNKVQALLAQGNIGDHKISMLLGSLKEKVNGTVRKRSQAPAPAPNVNGGTGGAEVIANEPSMMKKYNQLMDKGKSGEAFKILRAGRKAGFDVKKW